VNGAAARPRNLPSELDFVDFFLNERTVPVLLPIVAATAIAVCFFACLRIRRGRLNLLEVGSLYVAAVSLYTVYPLIGFLWNGCSHAPENDPRLFLAQPSSEEMALIGWFYVIHLVSFAIVYGIVSGRAVAVTARFTNLDSRLLPCAIFLYALITAFLLWVDFAYDLSAQSYSESYLVTRDRLPLLLG
jgi:hypothetical protein